MKRNLIPWRHPRTESAVARREESTPLPELHRRMNDLFEDFFTDFERSALGPVLGRGWSHGLADLPRVNVEETDTELVVTADLPGLEEKDVQVSVDDDLLTIRGERKQEHEEKRKDYHLMERSYGSFHRTLPLPASVDREKIKAALKKGVLTVTLPKRPEARADRKTIRIEAD